MCSGPVNDEGCFGTGLKSFPTTKAAPVSGSLSLSPPMNPDYDHKLNSTPERQTFRAGMG